MKRNMYIFTSIIPYLAVVVIFFGAVTFAVKRAYDLTIHIDPVLTSVVAHDIRAFIKDHQPLIRHRSAKKILTLLKANFPYIRRVTSRLSNNGRQILVLYAEKPLLHCNHESVITTTTGADVLPLDSWIYNQAQLECLPTMSVYEPLTAEHARIIKNFFMRVPRWVLEDYAALWHDKTLCELQPKKEAPRVFVMATTPLDENTREVIKLISRYCVKRDTEMKMVKKKQDPDLGWVIDMRCENLVILSRKKKGDHHE